MAAAGEKAVSAGSSGEAQLQFFLQLTLLVKLKPLQPLLDVAQCVSVAVSCKWGRATHCSHLGHFLKW